MTVNKRKAGRPRSSESQLSSDHILHSAKVLMREQGKIPSIRQLASSLNADPMAIYHYFANKNALLESLSASLLNDIYEPGNEQDWQQALLQLSISYLDLLSTYPGLLEIFLSMTSTTPADIFSERFFNVIEPLSLDQEEQVNALELLVDYLHGFSLAMANNKTDTELNSTMINGPLELYCRALMASKQHK